MDFNLVVLGGRLAAPPELRELEDGSLLCRYLLAVRSDTARQRIDVLPVIQWDPPGAGGSEAVVGARLWVAGIVQRRFWSADGGRRSRLQIVGRHVEFPGEQAEPARSTRSHDSGH